MATPLSNADLAELLLAAAAAEVRGSHRERAMLRAAGAALGWVEEAADVRGAGRDLTELTGVGPFLADRIGGWIADRAEAPPPPPRRSGFLTRAQARRIVGDDPLWKPLLRADFQLHTTYSDGHAPLRTMVAHCLQRGYEYLAVTDHSGGLRIANGMNEQRLEEQALDVAAVNSELAADGIPGTLLHGIEMNLSPEGAGDMGEACLRPLDLVLGAFHSKLRLPEDQTTRYVAALGNPTIDVLAHPRTRMWNVRDGLQADWRVVFEAALETDRAVECDCHSNRQDLDVDTLRLAAEMGVRISVGTDAHHPDELDHVEIGYAALSLAGVRPERVINCMPLDELLAWRDSHRR